MNVADWFNKIDKYKKEIRQIKKRYINETSMFQDKDDIKKWFEELLAERRWSDKDKTVIVFIDDLDRCEADNVINLLSSIKLFFTLAPQIVFVVGIDKQAVINGLKIKYNQDEEKADEYLEKIFSINFSMPKVVSTKKMVSTYFKNEEQDKATLISDMFDAIGLNNPRHIKKLLNKYNIVSSFFQFREEQDGHSLKFCILFYLIYLYELKPTMFKQIKSKRENRSRYVKAFDGNGKHHKIEKNSTAIPDVLWFFLEGKKEESLIPTEHLSRMKMEWTHINFNYFDKHEDFIKFLYTKFPEIHKLSCKENSYDLNTMINMIQRVR